jgi:hypothetical protein
MKDEYRLEAGFYGKIWGRHDYDIDAGFPKDLFQKHDCRRSSTLDAARATAS